jgi:hypothetical protein
MATMMMPTTTTNADTSELCDCATCQAQSEKEYIVELMTDDSVSMAEAGRWVLAEAFNGRMRCVR